MSEIVENPRGGCLLAGATATLAAIKGFCPVFHSGPGCAMQTSSSVHVAADLVDVAVPSSNMLEKEVVFGGANKLKTTLQGCLEVMDAEVFVVLTGCTAGIIGDDVNTVVEEFRNNGHEVYSLDKPGFLGNTELGYESLWNMLIEQFIEPRERQQNTVNLFGIIPGLDPYWRGNTEELTRILGKLGLKVNNFYRDEGVESVRDSSSAALNIIVHPWLFEGPAKKFEQRFGTPYVRIPYLPIGDTDTTEFIREIGRQLNLDNELVESVIKEEKAYLYYYLEQGIGALGWKRIGIVGDSSYVVGMTRYLANDYSLIPRLAIISEPVFGDENKNRIEGNLSELKYVKAPDIYFASDQYEIDQIIKKYDDIALFIGGSNDEEAASYIDTQFVEITFPVESRFLFNRTYAGYRGSLTLIEDLYNNL